MAAVRGTLLGRSFARRMLGSRAFCSYQDGNTAGEPPSFDDVRVKSLLKKITGRDLGKVFAARKESLSPPKYKLMTEKDLLKAQAEAEDRADNLLEMPPVLAERSEIREVLQEDSEIKGFDESSFVFTDISASATDRTRRIVVREPNGQLRKASWEERDRLNLLYFPKEGRLFELPEMLKDDHFEAVFNQNRHEDVLDRACVQCEPDSADYIRVHQRTYEDIVKRQAFNLLRSTRHFGGLAYHLTRTRNIKGLLDDMIERDLLDDAVAIVELHHLLHPNYKLSVEARQKNLEGMPLVLAFMKSEGSIQGLQRLKQSM